MTVSTPSGAMPRVDAVPALKLAVETVEAVRYAAVPTLAFRLRVERLDGGPVRSIALNAQIRIAATRRSYDAAAQERLFELFGPAEQWGRSLRSLLWTNASAHVAHFQGTTSVDLPVTCTYDFEVAAAKYLHALGDGDVPLELLFNGTMFYEDAEGRLRIVSLSWEHEAEARLPVRVWRELMDHYFPNSAWLRLGRDSFDRLYAFRTRRALPSWEETVATLLREAGGEG